MKKLYKSKEFCKFNERRCLRAIKRYKKALTGGSYAFGNSEKKTDNDIKHDNNKQRWLSNVIIANAPEIFSIINNRDEFMYFLNNFDSKAWHGKPVYINLANVKVITPDALLCIVAYLARYETLKRFPIINGNAPDDKHCNQIFHESGFYKYVLSDFKHKDTENVLSVRSDTMVNSIDAKAVIEFVRNKLNIKKMSITRYVFTTIMEAMNNVKEHAYRARKNLGWWLMALPEEDSNIIHFSLVDNGKSIPETMRKRASEHFTSNDGSLIRTAVLENRSETKLYYRGNGLPKLKKLIDDNLIKNLYIISKTGYYNVDQDRVYTLPCEYIGTIISWDFIGGNKNGN